MKTCLLAIAMLALWTSAASACRVPTIRTLDNQTVTGYMFAISGRPCSIIVRTTRGPISSASLVSNAKNGTVKVSGGRIVYTSRQGFVGEDEFTYARSGLNGQNQRIVRTVNVAVKVAAK